MTPRGRKRSCATARPPDRPTADKPLDGKEFRARRDQDREAIDRRKAALAQLAAEMGDLDHAGAEYENLIVTAPDPAPLKKGSSAFGPPSRASVASMVSPSTPGAPLLALTFPSVPEQLASGNPSKLVPRFVMFDAVIGSGRVLFVLAVGIAAPAERERAGPHWAYCPIEKPAVPAVRTSSWVQTPIDAFILARLEEKGLHPSPPADRRTFIRRISFDLLGLPPSPEEADEFAADSAPDAARRLVERFLASPHYGERWTRHWMDIIHFAETHGHDQDRPRPNAWPYRDYLINSFNSDKPYGRFVEEQIAGDALFPDDPRGVVALGFLAAGPWDESSQLNIVDDTVDKAIARYLDRDDMVTTALSAFSGATVHCARCHDHKFDPILQAEYYGLQAVFAGVDRAERSFDEDIAVHNRRRALRAELARIERAENDPSSDLLDPSAQAEVAVWERAFAEKPVAWTVLPPTSARSEGGSEAASQSDGSVLFRGKRPETDTYTLTAFTSLRRITGVRIEVLTDPSLPKAGPGRQDNGNLHLSEFRVEYAPRETTGPAAPKAAPAVPQAPPPAPQAPPTERRRRAGLRNPTADFDQDGWTVAMAMDEKLQTAWGIYPQVGKPHQAVFEVEEPFGSEGGTELTCVLEQKHGGGHLIGRPRISVTDATGKLRPSVLPDRIARVLATPAESRAVEERATLAAFVLREKIDRQLAELGPPRKVYAAASDFTPEGNFTPARGPRPVHILERGSVEKPKEAAAPGALSCVKGLEPSFKLANPADESSRRAALGRWLSDPKNVLTWRCIANRIWHYHFGRGLCDTPSDLGRMGSPPSHPELLDFLAATLIESEGSLKSLHRLILTSAVYAQSSRHDPEAARVDADNRLLWRMNRARLDAESLRDAVLVASGRLDAAMGGPSDKHFGEAPGVHVTPMADYAGFDVDSAAGRRRSIYRFIFRTLPDPLLDVMDCPDASQLAPARSTSVTALQALSLRHNKFIVRHSEHLAARVMRAAADPAGQVRELYRLVLARDPGPEEANAVGLYATKHGLANACRWIFNSNDFLFVE